MDYHRICPLEQTLAKINGICSIRIVITATEICPYRKSFTWMNVLDYRMTDYF
jgi:hypothetical protein